MARRSTVRCVEEFILFDALYEDETSWRSPPPSCGPDRPPIPVADRNGPPPSGIRSPGCRPRHSVRRGVGGMEKSEEQADASRGRGAERPARSAHPTRSTRRFAGGGYWLLPRPILAVVARRSPLISGIIGAAAHVVDSIASPPSGCMGLFLRFLRAPHPRCRNMAQLRAGRGQLSLLTIEQPSSGMTGAQEQKLRRRINEARTDNFVAIEDAHGGDGEPPA